MMQRISKIRGPVLIGSLVGVLTGIILGYTSGNISFVSENLKRQYKIVEFDDKYLVTFYIIGALFGCLAGIYFGNFLPIKVQLLITIAIGTSSSICLIFFKNIWVMTVLRGILGISSGLCSTIGPKYASECSPKDIRGLVGVIFQFSLTFAMFLSSFFAFAVNTNNVWRVAYGIALVPFAGLLFMTLVLVKETPRLLVSKGRIEDAEVQLGLIYKDDPEMIKQEIESIEEELKLTRDVSISIIFTKIGMKELMIGVILAAAQQLTGINAIIYYNVQIVSTFTKGESVVAWVSVAVFFWNFATTMFAVWFSDTMGRKKLIVGGIVNMGIAMLIFAITIEKVTGKTSFAICLLCILVYILGFEIGIGPLFWVIVNEVSGQQERAYIGSIVTASNFFFNTLTTLLFPVIREVINQHVFYIFFSFSIFFTVLIVLFVPETKGKSINEVQKMLVEKTFFV